MTHQNAEIAPAITIRPARPADLRTIVALDAASTGLEKTGYWAALLRRHGGGKRDRYFLAADDGDALVGFAVGEVRAWEFGSPPSGWIFAINVDQALRQQGLATLLFDAICERFRRAGVARVRTMVAKEDRLVMSFFRSQGLMAGPFIELEKALS